MIIKIDKSFQKDVKKIKEKNIRIKIADIIKNVQHANNRSEIRNIKKLTGSLNEYRIKVGKVVPLTIEQSIEIDGDLSRDGLFFFYSSNRERGNFDIYLRALEDITTVRITQHPSKDTSPAISLTE